MGGLLGWSAALIVAAARQAGDLVAAQAGLSAAALFDPETGDELTALGHLYGLIALAVFLALDGPLVLVGALIESYRAVPAGGLGRRARPRSRRPSPRSAMPSRCRSAPPPRRPSRWRWRASSWAGSAGSPRAVPFLALSLPVRSILGIVLVFLSLAHPDRDALAGLDHAGPGAREVDHRSNLNLDLPSS